MSALCGKPKMVAIGALMRKLVHWCTGALVLWRPEDRNRF